MRGWARVLLAVATVSIVLAPATTLRASERVRLACTITGTPHYEKLVGTSGPDVICAGRGADEIRGRGGDDVIYAGPGKDIAMGGRGDDTVYGGKGPDVLYGSPGDDDVVGGPGGDDVRGNHGFDQIRGGPGSDGCLSAIDGHGGDHVYGGPGVDTADTDPGDHLHAVEEVKTVVCYGE
jgi:Ca2+-binding RTX toxin-like protein